MRNLTGFFKKTAVWCLGAVLVLGLAACGEKTSSANTVVEQAAENFGGAKSYTYEINMDMSMTSLGQEIDMITTASCEGITDPLAVSVEMNMDMGQFGGATTSSYITKDGNEYTVYSGVDNGYGKTIWTKQIVDTPELLEQYDASNSITVYTKSAKGFTEAGNEKINGVETTRYDAVIDSSSLEEVLKASGMQEQFESLGLGEDMGDLYEGLGDMYISIWIDTEKMLPVKYELDMTQFLQAIMDKLMEDIINEYGDNISGNTKLIEIKNVTMEMIVTGIDNVDEIKIPKEALEAEEI